MTDSPAQHDDSAAPTVTFGAVLGALWMSRWKIILVGVAGFVAAAIFSLLIDPVFRSSTVVAEAEKAETGSLASLAGQLGGLGALAGLGLGSSPSLDQSLAVLQSVEFLQRFVVSAKVQPELFGDDWDLQNGRLKAGAGAGGGFWQRFVPQWRAKADAVAPPPAPGAAPGMDAYLTWESYRRFLQRLTIDRDRKTQLVTMSFDASTPEESTRIVNALVAALNAELRTRAIDESEKRIAYLEARASQVGTVEIREALYRLVESEQKRALVAHTREDYALRVLSPAIPPDMRAAPRRTLMAIGGGMLAGFCAVVWVLGFGATPWRRRPTV